MATLSNGLHSWIARSVFSVCLCASVVSPASAYVEAPHTLGQVVALASNIVVMRVEKVDREKNLIIYRKVRDLKGTQPGDVIKHVIGKAGFHEREWKYPMEWAEVGKTAIFFHNGGASETCIGTYWYQAYAGGEWWNHSHGEPFLLRSFAGNIDKLATLVTDIVAGKEVIAPCMVDGNKDDLHLRRAKIQRLKASLKILDYNPKRDFVGWGGEDFRRLSGMPGFTHYSALTRVDPDAQAVSAADIDGDGKQDLCLVGAGKIAILQNGGESLNEVALPGGVVGCRAAVWADYNADGKPDLLLATPAGPRLFTNLGGNNLRDDSALLPTEPAWNLTAAAWLDQDADGKPDILLGNGFHGLRLYKNLGQAQPKAFEDASAKVGLGPDGLFGTTKGDTLTVTDVNGDGRTDFLYGAGTGLLALNTPEGFKPMTDSGIAYKPGRVGPVFGDFDGDGRPDLFVPQANGCKLFHNDGNGKFSDATAKAGDLARPLGNAVCGAWGDFDNDGRLDLFVGCLRGQNRFFRNKGDGSFEDQSEAIGLTQKTFNTQAIGLVDLNNDGVLDAVFNNEGQESAVLLGNPEAVAKKTPLTLQIAGGVATGSVVKVLDKDGKVQGWQAISGGDGRGGQAAAQARFALAPGAYKIEVQYSSGVKRAKEIAVAATHVKGVIDDQTPVVK